jgi:hypothetical protein
MLTKPIVFNPFALSCLRRVQNHLNAFCFSAIVSVADGHLMWATTTTAWCKHITHNTQRAATLRHLATLFVPYPTTLRTPSF